VNRLVAFRAGGRTTFAEAAGRFRVPEQDVRRADRAVRCEPSASVSPGSTAVLAGKISSAERAVVQAPPTASSQAVVDAEAQEPAGAEQELAHLSVDDFIAWLPYIPALGRDGTAAWLRESERT
jgi:hypothetical protein